MQGGTEPHALSPDGRSAGPRGRAAAPSRADEGLHRGRRGVRGEASAGLHRGLMTARLPPPERRYNPRALRPLTLVTSRSRAATVLLCAALLALALPSAAFAGVLAPEAEGGSPNAEGIRDLYIITAILGAIIFVVVEGLLIYALIKFRHKRGGTPPAQIRGNTPLEIGWTLGAAAILVVLTVVTFIFLPGIKNPAKSKDGGYVAQASDSGSGPGGTTQFAALDQKKPDRKS